MNTKLEELPGRNTNGSDVPDEVCMWFRGGPGAAGLVPGFVLEWFGTIFDNCRPLLLHVAGQVLRNEHDAEDAVQDAVSTCLERVGTLRDPAKIVGWMVRSVRNQSIDHLRRRRAMVPLECAEWDGDGAVGVTTGEDLEVRVDVTWSLQRVVEELPEDQSQVLWLNCVEGHTMGEVALRCGIERNNAYQKLYRARIRIKGMACFRDLRGWIQGGGFGG